MFFQIFQHLPEFFTGYRVDSGGRFIKKKNLRRMNKRTTECQFLLHTSRQLSGFPGFKRFYLLVDIFNQMIILLNRGVENGSEESQVLLYRQIGIKRETPRHIANLFTDLLVILHHIQSIYGCRAFVCQQQCGQYAEKCSLSGTIRTYDTIYLSFVHIKTQVADSLYFTVAFLKIPN